MCVFVRLKHKEPTNSVRMRKMEHERERERERWIDVLIICEILRLFLVHFIRFISISADSYSHIWYYIHLSSPLSFRHVNEMLVNY